MRCIDCAYFCFFGEHFDQCDDEPWCGHEYGRNDPKAWDEACEHFEEKED